MNKIFKKLALMTALGVFGLVISASAATTLSVTPVNISAIQGEEFMLEVRINPQGIKNYTAKIELEYPADLLEVKSFTFENTWMSVNQPGYDLIDNTNGILIKTAGYPGGVSSSEIFGTVLFSTKKAGEGIIKIMDDSLILDAENQNVLNDASVQVNVIIGALPTLTGAPAPSGEAGEPTGDDDDGDDNGDDNGNEGEMAVLDNGGQKGFFGGFLAGIAGLGSGWTSWLILLGIVLLVLCVLFAIRKRKRKIQ